MCAKKIGRGIMVKPNDVFISYSSKEREIADELVRILSRYELKCWIAHRDIPAGADWPELITHAINNSKAYVLVLSKESVASGYVAQELGVAMSAGLDFYPFQIEECKLKGEFDCVRRYQKIDATEDWDKAARTLAYSIRQKLGMEPLPEKREKPPADNEKEERLSAAKEKAYNSKTVAKQRKLDSISHSDYTGWKTFLKIIIIALSVSGVSFFCLILQLFIDGIARERKIERMKNEPISGPVAGDGSSPLFGVWKLIMQEDNGDNHFQLTEGFVVCSDGGVYPPYSRWEYYYAGRSDDLPKLIWSDNGLNIIDVFLPSLDTDVYSLDADSFLTDSFASAIAHQKTDEIPPEPINVLPQDITIFPSGYSVFYPKQFLAVHITGYYTESPLRRSSVDTWLVYENQKNTISVDPYQFPTLWGTWLDQAGNSWDIWPGTDGMEFIMTENETKHSGKNISVKKGEDGAPVFNFWRISFDFDDLSMKDNVIIHYDGNLLYMLDENGKPFYLVRQ